jgi:hypothetical protein
LSFVAALFLSPPLQAQNMVLRLQGGTEQTIHLSNLQKITFSGSNLVLNLTSGSTQSYGFSNLEKMYFTPLTSIKNTVQAKADIFFNPTDNEIHFRNLAAGAQRVVVYRMDGLALINTTVTNDETIDMSGYPASIYLIRINNQILKFKK